MAPRSLVARLTPSLVAGFDTYGFDREGGFRDLARINENDLPGDEFVVAGALARDMDDKERKRLEGQGVHFEPNPQKALAKLAKDGLGG